MSKTYEEIVAYRASTVQKTMKAFERARSAKAWLSNRGETEVKIWNPDKIKQMGFTWGRDAAYIVVCEGEFEWTHKYCNAMFCAHTDGGAYYEPGTDWALCIYKDAK